MPSVLVTGANRGLGLEFTRQYAADGWRVHACCRDPEAADALREVAASGDVAVHRLDVADGTMIQGLARELDGEALDVLLNNAGVWGPRRQAFGETDYAAWEDVLRINVLGPLAMARAFLPHLERGTRRVLASLTSGLGSIADNRPDRPGGIYLYRSSKAALNMATRSLAIDLRDRGIIVVALSPGHVRTDMGGAGAPLAPADSIAALRAVIDGLDASSSGRYLTRSGEDYPW